MKFAIRFLTAVLILSGLSAGGVLAWIEATRVTVAELPALRTGDIVFQESGSAQTKAIALASSSLYTHTGIVEISPDGQPFVIEAARTVRTIPLADWIAHGTAGRITIKRLPALSEPDARRVIAAAHTYDGRPYDFYFYETPAEIYCSELVQRAFKEGAGISIGKTEQVKDLNIDNAAARSLIEARWREHPLCRDRGASDFATCYGLILQQTLVTPAAVARDTALDLVYSNFGFAGD